MTYEKACPHCGGDEYTEKNENMTAVVGRGTEACGCTDDGVDGGSRDVSNVSGVSDVSGARGGCCCSDAAENDAGGSACCGDADHSCCGKKTERSERERQKLIHRLNRIEGQIRGIRGMVENNAYCADILIQSAAVNAAVSAFNRELLSSHIHGCVARDIRAGKDEVIDELMQTLGRLMK